jgi:hypothetical protein
MLDIFNNRRKSGLPHGAHINQLRKDEILREEIKNIPHGFVILELFTDWVLLYEILISGFWHIRASFQICYFTDVLYHI